MEFFSTRDHSRIVTASQAIAQGLSDEGGLFVPESFPQVDVEALRKKRHFKRSPQRLQMYRFCNGENICQSKTTVCAGKGVIENQSQRDQGKSDDPQNIGKSKPGFFRTTH